mgnify:CR=1 FL=1
MNPLTRYAQARVAVFRSRPALSPRPPVFPNGINLSRRLLLDKELL